MEAKDVCLQIENDEFFCKYLVDNVKSKSTENLSVSEQVNRLTKAIEQLNTVLEKQVLVKHNDLLAQACHVAELEGVLDSIQLNARTLMSEADKIKSKVTIPHNHLENNAKMLKRVQKTCHYMRHVLKILSLYKMLKSTNDPPREAIILSEINDFLSDDDFTGIVFIDNIMMDIKSKQKNLLARTSKELQECLLSSDKAKLIDCFKVFRNLQCTNHQVDTIVSDILTQLTKLVTEALNINIIQESKKSSSGSRHTPGRANVLTSQEVRQILWKNLENLFANSILNECKKIIMLQSALNELHIVGNFNTIGNKFWEKFTHSFTTEINKCSVVVAQCLEIDFPRLLKCFNDLIAKLKHRDFVLKRELLSKWENAFLSKTLSNLLEPIRSMWQHGAPSSESIDNTVRSISTIMSVSLGDKQLSNNLAQSVAKCIKQMCLEAEQRLHFDADLAQIIEAPTTTQQKNADICNALNYFCVQIKRVLNNMSGSMPTETIQIVHDGLKCLTSKPVLQPLAVSICSSINKIMLTLQDEPDLNRSDSPDGRNLTCSAYMKELQQFVLRCRDIYLNMFEDTTSVEETCIHIANHSIERFLWQACNIRPISRFGRVKLRLDCERLEVALTPLISNYSRLGEKIRWLKAFHSILALSLNEIVESQKEGGALPVSLVMMYMFSFASEHLVSPGVAAGWDNNTLMCWLEKHTTERERLDFVAGALKRYQHYVHTNNITNYDPVYPLLLQMLEDSRK